MCNFAGGDSRCPGQGDLFVDDGPAGCESQVWRGGTWPVKVGMCQLCAGFGMSSSTLPCAEWQYGILPHFLMSEVYRVVWDSRIHCLLNWVLCHIASIYWNFAAFWFQQKSLKKEASRHCKQRNSTWGCTMVDIHGLAHTTPKETFIRAPIDATWRLLLAHPVFVPLLGAVVSITVWISRSTGENPLRLIWVSPSEKLPV